MPEANTQFFRSLYWKKIHSHNIFPLPNTYASEVENDDSEDEWESEIEEYILEESTSEESVRANMEENENDEFPQKVPKKKKCYRTPRTN